MKPLIPTLIGAVGLAVIAWGSGVSGTPMRGHAYVLVRPRGEPCVLSVVFLERLIIGRLPLVIHEINQPLLEAFDVRTAGCPIATIRGRFTRTTEGDELLARSSGENRSPWSLTWLRSFWNR